MKYNTRHKTTRDYYYEISCNNETDKLFLNIVFHLVRFKSQESEPKESDRHWFNSAEGWIRKTARKQHVLPSALFLTDVQKEEEYQRCGGQSADVYLGKYEDKRVAVKVFRIWSKVEDLKKVLI